MNVIKQTRQVIRKALYALAQAQTYEVKQDDTLSQLAKEFYGSAKDWPIIFEANKDQIEDPNLIQPGWVLKIPAKEDAPSQSETVHVPSASKAEPRSQSKVTSTPTSADAANSTRDLHQWLQTKEPGDKSINLERFKAKCSKLESGGNYTVVEPHTNATGKYQFVWSIWKKEISKFAGREISQDDFRGNPQLQEAFMDYYLRSTVLPSVKQLEKQYPQETAKLSMDQMMAMIHFKGLRDSGRLLQGHPDRTLANNAPVADYLRMIG